MTKISPIQSWCLIVLLPALIPWHAAYAGITPAKEDIVFIVDNSSAMQQGDPQMALPDSIRAFVGQFSRDVRAALILFDENATLRVPFISINSEQLSQFVEGLETIDYSDRFSNSAAALERALHELQSSGREGTGKSIILFTYGRIDTGNEAHDLNFTEWMSSVLAEDAAVARIRIFCIAFPGLAETPALEDISRQTGGSFYRFTGDREMSSLFNILADDLFFKPAATSDGASQRK